MIRTWGTGRVKFKRGPGLKIYPKTGNVRFAVPAPRHLIVWGKATLINKEDSMKWLQFLTPVKSIAYEETREMIARAKADEITILDVRQPNEYQQSHIPGATLIPLPELIDRLGELDTDKPVLVY